MSRETDLVAELTKLGYRVTPPRPKSPAPRCYVCGSARHYGRESYDTTGIPDDAFDADYLTQVIVVTNPQEEGYDKVVRFFCDMHDAEAIEALEALGYQSHHHGGTALLQDQSCRCGEQRSPYDMDDNGLYIEHHW